MQPQLATFLEIAELDDLLLARESIASLSKVDNEAIITILKEWKDKQAIANLLQHPDLIPEPLRFGTLLKALQAEQVQYYPVAATVGLQGLESDVFSVKEQSSLAKELLVLLENDGVAAGRASITSVQYMSAAQHQTLFPFLAHPNEAVQHNIIVGLIKLVGLQKFRAVMTEAIGTKQIPTAALSFVNETLAEFDQLPVKDGTVDKMAFILSSLSAPLLTYIPNLKDML